MYIFKLKYDSVERKLKVYDEHTIWLGTVLLQSNINIIWAYIDHNNLSAQLEKMPYDGRKLSAENLKALCIELAATSGIDEDIIDELQEGWNPVDYACIDFKLSDIIYSDKSVVNDIDSQIFNYWMKK